MEKISGALQHSLNIKVQGSDNIIEKPIFLICSAIQDPADGFVASKNDGN
jgi:hypothetical protein